MKVYLYDDSGSYRNYDFAEPVGEVAMEGKLIDLPEDSITKFQKISDDYWSMIKQLERINVNGNYTKSNCKWATMKEQANNKRNSKKTLAPRLKK